MCAHGVKTCGLVTAHPELGAGVGDPHDSGSMRAGSSSATPRNTRGTGLLPACVSAPMSQFFSSSPGGRPPLGVLGASIRSHISLSPARLTCSRVSSRFPLSLEPDVLLTHH